MISLKPNLRSGPSHRPGGSHPHLARQMYDHMCGLHRAAYWREFGFPNLVRARLPRPRSARSAVGIKQPSSSASLHLPALRGICCRRPNRHSAAKSKPTNREGSENAGKLKRPFFLLRVVISRRVDERDISAPTLFHSQYSLGAIRYSRRPD